MRTMRWYFPTWNGDIRAAVDPKDSERTILTIVDPTAHELEVLKLLAKIFRQKKWYSGQLWKMPEEPENDDPNRQHPAESQQRTIKAPLADIVPLLVKGYKPGDATLSAVVFKDGRVEVVSGSDVDVEALAKKASTKGKAAVTVERPTPSCPACVPGSVDPATEVLLDFLDEHEHQQWAETRSIMVRGGISGHRYLISHRHTDRALRQGRICFDLDHQTVLHFHDNGVPPEEEVLATKLILEHREPWLRNEATVLGSSPWALRLAYKNPFGDGSDGVADAGLTGSIGTLLRGLVEGSP